MGTEKLQGHLTVQMAFFALVKPECPNCKCCLLFVSFICLYLPVCTLVDIKAAEPVSAIKQIEHFIDARQSTRISLGPGIQLPKGNTEPNLPIRLANQDLGLHTDSEIPWWHQGQASLANVFTPHHTWQGEYYDLSWQCSLNQDRGGQRQYCTSE